MSPSNDEARTAPQKNDKQPLSRLLKHKEILIADDMVFNRYINKEIVRQLGGTSTEVNNGKDALKCLLKRDYDIAMFDINMPHMDGTAVVANFLSTNPIHCPLFIALSASHSTETEATCLQYGFKYFIEKPLELSKLTKILAPERAQNTQDLLQYLEQSAPNSGITARERYRSAFLEELKQLRNAYQQKSLSSIQTSLHKLIGLAQISRNDTVIQALAALSEQKKTPHTTESLQLCDQIEAEL
ncbi:MAG: response regulator [Opitutaceae bacterium]